MRLSMRLKLFIVPVVMCLTLFLSMSGTAFATSTGRHPLLSGPQDATASNGCISIKVHGSDFAPSTTNTPNAALVVVVADTNHNVYAQTTAPISANGKFSTVFTICNITVLPDKIQYVALDETTGFYTNLVFTKAKK